MQKILLDENDNPLTGSFISSQFADFGYDYKKTEKGMKWTKLHRKPDIKLDKELDHRYERLERHFLEKWKADTPEMAARNDGFPEGWNKHIGGDEDSYDIYIDRYSKKGLVTVWKDKGHFWWWGPSDGSETHQTLSKYEAIDAAEQWLKKVEQE